MNSFSVSTDIVLDVPESIVLTTPSTECFVQLTARRPPEKTLIMPNSITSPTSPTSPGGDSVKKTPPPVASKPRNRSSLLSIISNQRVSTSSDGNSKSLELPPSEESDVNKNKQYNEGNNVNENMEKENIMPPPPSEEVLAKLSEEAMETDDMDFPPPPPEEIDQMQQALDDLETVSNELQAALTSNVRVDANHENDTSETGNVDSSNIINDSMEYTTTTTHSSLDDSNISLSPTGKDTDITNEKSLVDESRNPDQVDNASVAEASNDVLNAQFNGVITSDNTDDLKGDSSSNIPSTHGTMPAVDFDDNVTTIEDKLVGNSTTGEDHRATLPLHSSFSTSEALETSDQLKPEVNHNNQTDKVSCMSNQATACQTLSNTQANPAANPAALQPMSQYQQPCNTSSESGDSGIYSLVGETIQVQLRPIKNDNRKPDYSVPIFERNSGEIKRVTFRESSSSSQQIMPAVVQRSAKEQERIRKTGLSEVDVSQIELFYKGHKSEVMVCPCLATLYFAKGVSGDSVGLDDWKPEHIGIPVLVYDTGDGKRSRGLTMAFAEKGTGFSLWKTVINYESRWEIVEKVFHRLRIPGTHDELAGIAYQDEACAESFYQYYRECTADPELNVLNNPNIKIKKKKEKRKSQKKSSIRLPRKMDISLPCEFSHVTQLKQSEDGILAMNMVDDESVSSEDGTVISK